MSASTEEIFNFLKKNGFDISLLELKKILATLVTEGLIQRNAIGVGEQRCLKFEGGGLTGITAMLL
jgi:Fe2+ or Zn2+ uptake regulation protein